MLDLNKIVNDKLKEIEESDFIGKKIEAYLKDSIEDAIKDSIGRYSSVNRDITEEIKSQLDINVEKLNVVKYNKMMFDQIEAHLKDRLVEVGIEDVVERINKLITTSIPKEIKMSELIEDFKTSIDFDDYDCCGEFEATLIIENSSIRGFTTIYLDEEEGKSKYSCKYRIHLYDNKISRIDIDDKTMDNKMVMGGMYGFDSRLFMMFASGCSIVFDEEEASDYDLTFEFYSDEN